jgi:hypothetical protein
MTSKKPVYIKFKPATARTLSSIALSALYGWFLCKFLVDETKPGLQLFVGFLALVGMVTAILVFLSANSFLATAPKDQIDERELAQRNEAYFRAYLYMIGAVLVGLLAMHFWERSTGLTISVHQFRNFLTVLFFTGLVMPASVLAYQDKSDVDD